MPSSFIIGIDLGTTNCAIAFARIGPGNDCRVEDFLVPQLLRPGEVASRALLPSCLYSTGEHELPSGATVLPWGESPKLVAGEFARWQGARVPGRLVASAKSWLCHAGVDRSAAILPWGAPVEVAKVSPVEASTALLQHLMAAWNHAHPDRPFNQQEVVITVPASFDEVARALTVSAARQAEITQLTLVEEPQAAFYDFTARHRQDLGEALKDIRLVLVVDVGGGTTDFTLIQTGVSPDGPMLRRLAVGEHLMLGGDNMDAALARLVEERLVTKGRKLSATQWTQLVHAARTAKETLLGENAPERHGFALAAEGSRLLGGTLSAELLKTEVERVILEGFFPACTPADNPQRAARMALQELGLPYAQDPSVTRHLAAFLRRHAAAGFGALGVHTGMLPRPDAILLNGGVFNSPQIARRSIEIVSAWWPDAPCIPLLQHTSLELSVARGAAWYGLVRRGLGRRIGGGTSHALYVGLAGHKADAVPKAVCLIPRGHEESQSVELDLPFTLAVGQPVQFPLFSTASDRFERSGEVAEMNEDFHALPPIHTVFKAGSGRAESVPVHLRATLTEIGTLELWCVAQNSDKKWRLEFELRGSIASGKTTITESMPARFAEACEKVARVYGNKPLAIGPQDIKQLSRTLEKTIGPREQWRLPLLREIWSTLFAGAAKRRRSVDHERVYFQLLGYSLRPGFGYPLDEWRCEQTFRLFEEGVKFHAEEAIWKEFWILWRRLSGGLTEAQQKAIGEYLQPYLARRVPPEPGRNSDRTAGVQPEGLDEMVRTAASLEHLEVADKVALGQWITARIKHPSTTGGPWAWALGRLGTRVPIYGSGHKTVPPELASEWVDALLSVGLERMDGAPFAVAQLTRMTGDRTRDVEVETRERAVAALKTVPTAERWLRLVTEVVEMETSDEARALGDTLPLGLKLHESHLANKFD